MLSRADTTVRIGMFELADLADLEAMYATFTPLGSANGLPPVRPDRRRDWLEHLAARGTSLIARRACGEVVGHAALVPSDPGQAELAVFVHQDWRTRAIGTALARAAVELAVERGHRRLWAQTLAANRPAIRMVESCGFRCRPISNDGEVELELSLD